MSLAGLLNILDDDPQLRDVLARAGTGTGPVDTDLVEIGRASCRERV